MLVRVFESREQQTQGEVDSPPRMCFPMRPHRTARIVGNYASVEKEVLQTGAGLAGCNSCVGTVMLRRLPAGHRSEWLRKKMAMPRW